MFEVEFWERKHLHIVILTLHMNMTECLTMKLLKTIQMSFVEYKIKYAKYN